MAIRWNLKHWLAAERRIYRPSELQPLLAERGGLHLSLQAVSTLMRRPPDAIRFPTIEALCRALDCKLRLKPLLERFECQRAERVRYPNNCYVFVPPALARHATPTFAYVQLIVRRVTRRLLGGACNITTLRKTVGVKLASLGGEALLREMGWSGQQAFWYGQPIHEVIHPA